MKKEQQKKQLHELFTNQRLAVLATLNNNEPYTSLVAFSATEDLSYLIFATLRQTQKFNNIIQNGKISMLIDNRENLSTDVKNAMAVTVVGIASEIKEKQQYFLDIHFRKHPYLREFLKNENCVLVGLSIEKIIIVTDFQQITFLNRQATENQFS